MSKLNASPRKFHTKQRMVYIPHLAQTIPLLATRGTWPVVHMVDEDTFVQMAILAKHITPDARKRYAHSREN